MEQKGEVVSIQNTRSAAAGRAAPSMGPRERRLLLRLFASAAVLLLAVGLKLSAPELTARLRADFVQLVGAETDVKAVFSAVGKAVSGEGEEPWQEVYRAVFSPISGGEESGEVPEETAPMEETAPAEEPQWKDAEPQGVCMMQQVLGFDFATPLAAVISSAFGQRESPTSGREEFHYGVDLAAAEGTEITAFAAGTVRAVGDSSSLGKYLILDHGENYSTLYAHCSRITAAAGEQVRLGQTIAEVGQSGNATGPHLHFVLQRGSTYLNPVYYL